MFDQFKFEYIIPLSQIIRKNWNYLEYGRSDESCQTFALEDLYNVLIHSNYTDLYLFDNKPVAFLFAHIPGLGTPFDSIKEEITKLKFNNREEAKLFSDYADLYEKTNKQLLGKSGIKDLPEITLFAINPDYQNKGIGKVLLNRFLQTIKKLGFKRCFLFTDSTCNFKFYEHQNFKRLEQENHRAALRDNEIIQFYLYAN